MINNKRLHGRTPHKFSAVLLSAVLVSGCSNQYASRDPLPAPQHIPDATRDQFGTIAVTYSEEPPSIVGFGSGYGAQGDEIGRNVGAGVEEGFNATGEAFSEGGALGLLLLPIILPVAMITGAVAGKIEKEINEGNVDRVATLTSAGSGSANEVMVSAFKQLERRWGQNFVSDREIRVPTGPEPVGLFLSESDKTRDFVTIPALVPDSELEVGLTSINLKTASGSADAEVQISASATLSSRDNIYEPVMAFAQTSEFTSLRKLSGSNQAAWHQLLKEAAHTLTDELFNQLFLQTSYELPIEPIATDGHLHFDPHGLSQIDGKNRKFAWTVLEMDEETASAVPAPIGYLFYESVPLDSHQLPLSSIFAQSFAETWKNPNAGPNDWRRNVLSLDWRTGVFVTEPLITVTKTPCKQERRRWTVQPVFEIHGMKRLGQPMPPAFYQYDC